MGKISDPHPGAVSLSRNFHSLSFHKWDQSVFQCGPADTTVKTIKMRPNTARMTLKIHLRCVFTPSGLVLVPGANRPVSKRVSSSFSLTLPLLFLFSVSSNSSSDCQLPPALCSQPDTSLLKVLLLWGLLIALMVTVLRGICIQRIC